MNGAKSMPGSRMPKSLSRHRSVDQLAHWSPPPTEQHELVSASHKCRYQLSDHQPGVITLARRRNGVKYTQLGNLFRVGVRCVVRSLHPSLISYLLLDSFTTFQTDINEYWRATDINVHSNIIRVS